MNKKETLKVGEGTVKKWVKDALAEYGAYYFMPVQTGIGASGVDFHCVIGIHSERLGIMLPISFFVETKDFGEEPTERQKLFIADRKERQGAITFVIDGIVGVNKLKAWLATITEKGY